MSSVSITLLQSDLVWEDKPENLRRFAEKIEGIPGKTHVIVLPEMFSTGFSMRPELLAETMEGVTVSWMKKMAAFKNAVITGSVIVKESDPLSQEECYFNRLIWMLPNGQFGVYDKRHLFGYAQEDKHYCAGNQRLIASVNSWKVNLMVCYDLRFPVWSRQAPQGNKNPEYDILIYIANWPEKRNEAWKSLLKARAIENQCYVIGVNRVGRDGNEIYYNGNSMVIDPLGSVLYQKEGSEDAFTIVFEKSHLEEVRSRFPFWRDGDDFRIFPFSEVPGDPVNQ